MVPPPGPAPGRRRKGTLRAGANTWPPIAASGQGCSHCSLGHSQSKGPRLSSPDHPLGEGQWGGRLGGVGACPGMQASCPPRCPFCPRGLLMGGPPGGQLPVSTPHHSSDSTRLPDLPPTLKSTTRCVCLLCFMVSAASVTSSEDHLSKRPSTCPYVPPDTGSVRAGTQGGSWLERKWWMPDPQAGLHGLCTCEDPQPSWMEF